MQFQTSGTVCVWRYVCLLGVEWCGIQGLAHARQALNNQVPPLALNHSSRRNQLCCASTVCSSHLLNSFKASRLLFAYKFLTHLVLCPLFLYLLLNNLKVLTERHLTRSDHYTAQGTGTEHPDEVHDPEEQLRHPVSKFTQEITQPSQLCRTAAASRSGCAVPRSLLSAATRGRWCAACAL